MDKTVKSPEIKPAHGKWFDVVFRVPDCDLDGDVPVTTLLLAKMGYECFQYAYWKAFVYPNSIEFKFDRISMAKMDGLSETFREVCDLMPPDMQERCKVSFQDVEYES